MSYDDTKSSTFGVMVLLLEKKKVKGKEHSKKWNKKKDNVNGVTEFNIEKSFNTGIGIFGICLYVFYVLRFFIHLLLLLYCILWIEQDSSLHYQCSFPWLYTCHLAPDSRFQIPEWFSDIWIWLSSSMLYEWMMQDVWYVSSITSCPLTCPCSYDYHKGFCFGIIIRV